MSLVLLYVIINTGREKNLQKFSWYCTANRTVQKKTFQFYFQKKNI